MRIGLIVQCRMKSTRLPSKALLQIHGVPFVRRCLGNCLRFPCPKENVILATSWLTTDLVLRNHLAFPGGNVCFFQGHPDNLIQRHYEAARNFHNCKTGGTGLDVVIRVTGDNPCPSPEIAEVLLESHLKTGADYTEAERAAIGTACQVWNTGTLGKLNHLFPSPKYSEHMDRYVTNNPEHFRINRVTLPQELTREYRLTLDYPEDLEMFKALYKKLFKNGKIGKVSIHDIFAVLDENPEIPAVNSHCKQAIQDPELSEKIKKDSAIK